MTRPLNHPVIYDPLACRSGFGNQIIGLAKWLHVLKSLGRYHVMYASKPIWHDYFLTLPIVNHVESTTPVCNSKEILPDCIHAIHNNQTVLIKNYNCHGISGAVFTNLSKNRGLTDFNMAREVHRILVKPTLFLQKKIDDQLLEWNVHLPFDLGLHLRQCVDCGDANRMTTSEIEFNVDCILKHVRLRPNATVFFTSDAQNHTQAIRNKLPSSVRFFNTLTPFFIHTSANPSKHTQEFLHLPYLDNWFLSQSSVVGSCYTTFGQIAVRHSNSAVQKIVTWTHRHEPKCQTDDL